MLGTGHVLNQTIYSFCNSLTSFGAAMGFPTSVVIANYTLNKILNNIPFRIPYLSLIYIWTT